MTDTTVWRALWLSRIDDYLEIRLIPSKKQLWSKDSGEIERFIQRGIADKENVYFGVCGRVEEAGGKEAIRSVHCVWADIDFKDLSGGKYLLDAQGKPFAENPNWNETDARIEADGILATFDHRPSLFINSGAGYHVYWFLEQPTEDVERVECILRGLVPRLKADSQSAEIARILRVPGTLNFKYDPPREVKVQSYNFDNTYTLDDFKEWEIAPVVYDPVIVDDTEERLDVPRYLKHYNVGLHRIKKYGESTLFCLKKCLFADEHTTGETQGESAIGQQPNGKLFYQCFHAHCAEHTWHDVKAKISCDDSLETFRGRDVKGLVEKYVGKLTGITSIQAMLQWLEIKRYPEREEVLSVLQGLVDKRVVAWTRTKNGLFRPVDNSPRVMQLWQKKNSHSR